MMNSEYFEQLLGMLESLSLDEREILWRRLGALRRKTGEGTHET